VIAFGAELVRGVPAKHRLRRSSKLGVTRRKPCHDTAQLGEHLARSGVGVLLFGGVEELVEQRFVDGIRLPRVQRESKARCPVFPSQQDRRLIRACQNRVIHRQTKQMCRAVFLNQRLATPQGNCLRLRVCHRSSDSLSVGTHFTGPVQPRSAKRYCLCMLHFRSPCAADLACHARLRNCWG